jgi:phosphate starvation-inducible membrane PsiE
VVVTDPVDADDVEAVADAVPEAVSLEVEHANNAVAMINGITSFFILFDFYCLIIIYLLLSINL